MIDQGKIDDVVAIASQWGVTVATEAVCEGHSAPARFLAEWIFERPPMSLLIGPRGGGKSFLRALAIHIDSMHFERMGTRILGGSLAQSKQIYDALENFERVMPDEDIFRRLLKTEAEYSTGSRVSILAASRTSVRGPHVQNLCLDEVDEIDPEIRESANGMCMTLHGIRGSIAMTSTWHRVGGPVTKLIEKGRKGAFPVHTFCAFEVLERCPDDRSGPDLEHCPGCPLRKWCHSDMDGHGRGVPKAKRSSGHYTIDSLIQKVHASSNRVFESDYLCLGPKSDGVWFTQFDEPGNVSDLAEYDPLLPVHMSVDSGVFTGAVLFQVRPVLSPAWPHKVVRREVNVFADYLSEDRGAANVAADLIALHRTRCGSAPYRFSTDSAGGSRNPSGPTVFAEYERAGLCAERRMEHWPKFAGCVTDGLAIVEALVRSADDQVGLRIHSRCTNLIDALKSYRRARRAGQWMDYPEDPQHPHEELIDALRGGLKVEFPEGLEVRQYERRVSARKL